jgi:hypothetical protein
MSADYTFKSILGRFASTSLWCAGTGALAGLLYRAGTQSLKTELVAMLGELSSPKTFHAIAVLVALFLGAAIALFGRQSTPSAIRIFFCYRPADVALSLCAVFVGLLFGFGVGVNHPPLAWGAIFAFFFSGFLLLVILWLSFPGKAVRTEMHARLGAAIFALSSAAVLWWVYGR